MKYRLTMRSGVAECNDNEIADFKDEQTAYLIGELLWALDRHRHPEYKGYDVVDIQEQQSDSTQP